MRILSSSTLLALLAALPVAARGGDGVVPGEVHVKLRVRSDAAAVLADAGLEGSHRATFLPVPSGRRNDVGLDRIVTARVPEGGEHELARRLSRDPRVEWAEVNRRAGGPAGLAGAGRALVPDDPRFAAQWALDQASDVDMDLPEAWALHGTFSADPDLVVAVVDTGTLVPPASADLRGALWTNPDELPNGLDDDGNGLVDDLHAWDFAEDDAEPDAGDPHGVWVAGVIAAGTDDGAGIAGVADGVRLMPVKVFDDDGLFPSSGPWQGVASAAAGIQYAVDQGAHVINTSWWNGTLPSSVINAAITYAADNGVHVTGIAGNFGTTSAWPGQHEDVIGVAAIDASGVKSVWCTVDPCQTSGYGAWVDLCAAGSDVLTTDPGGAPILKNGTSMAAPQVAGVIALLLSEDRDLSVADVRAVLRAGAVDVDPLNPGYEGLLGAGHVNARASLALLAPFADAGPGLRGTDAPVLNGWGATGAGDVLTLSVSRAPAATAGALVVGLAPQPGLGSLVLPVPTAVLPVVTSGDGDALLELVLDAPLPAGPALWIQAGFPDPAAPHGVTLSTCLVVSGG